MTKRKPLEFTEEGWPTCMTCADMLCKAPYLVEACASVGIEHGKSTAQMLREYLSTFHERRHRDPA